MQCKILIISLYFSSCIDRFRSFSYLSFSSLFALFLVFPSYKPIKTHSVKIEFWLNTRKLVLKKNPVFSAWASKLNIDMINKG